MRKFSFLLIMAVFVFVGLPGAYAKDRAGTSPVHEQRKTMREKQKEVYGPKVVGTTDIAQPPSGEKPPVMVKPDDQRAGASQGVAPGKRPEVRPAKSQGKSAKKPIPPPSRALQSMKKRREAEAVLSPAQKTPDSVGTVRPTALPSGTKPRTVMPAEPGEGITRQY
jgi:hypothetical protein